MNPLIPHAGAKQRLESFKNDISAVYPELLSLIAYGSAVGESFSEKVSDVNLLLVLPRLDAAVLERGADTLRRHWKKSRILPVIFSEQELRDSLDVFAIEFSEIRERHVVLKGADILETLVIPGTWLRHQCEFELRSKVLGLRRGFIEHLSDEKRLKELLTRALSGVLPLGRTMLRLAAEKPPHAPRELIQALARRYEFPEQPWMEVLALREGAGASRPARVLFGEFLSSVDGLTRRLNDAL